MTIMKILFMQSYEHLEKGMSNLSETDRMIIKFFYLPESLNVYDIRLAAQVFQLSILEVLNIQKRIIETYYKDIATKRKIIEKISKINNKLVSLKHQLFKKNSEGSDFSFEEKNKLLIQIARYENSKSKSIRELESPKNSVFKEFNGLFKNVLKAREKLKVAKSKLRFEILKHSKIRV